MPSILIIGMGASGLLLLHMFQAEGVSPDEILCIDPFFDGGALQRQWPFVTSNTPWQRVSEALKVFHPSYSDTRGLEPTQTTNLHEAIRAVREPIQSYLQRCHLVTGYANAVSYENGAGLWRVEVGSTSYEGNLLFLCYGSEAKTLALPIPSIPLSTAFHLPSLSAAVDKKDRVLVFGTSHSGALILKNLNTIGSATTAVYRGEKPFIFARDGEYDGIKEEAATIADAILASEYKNVSLIRAEDIGSLAKSLRTADWVIYATGFTGAGGNIRSSVNLDEYDGTTGRLGAPSCWGFGIAFPNTTRLPDGTVHKDVSLLAFAIHISKQRQDIMAEFKSKCEQH